MASDVDACIAASARWSQEMAALRPILLDCGLTEAVKWRKPCYVHDGANVAIMQEMKDFLALMFFKGALLDDPHGVLEAQGPNSRSAKRMTFAGVEDVARRAGVVREYVARAIAAEDEGLEAGRAPEPDLVAELTARLDGDPELRAAFEGLTPGRRREYNLYFADAKQADTRERRIDKYVDRIRSGRGMRDR